MNDSLPPFASESLKFAEGGKIIFCSEQDGRNHLYSVSTQGGQPVLLTAGKFDVEDVELTPDKTAALYTSNQNDEERRHVFKIPLGAAEIVNGKAIGVNVPITHGATIEWHPLMLADGKTIVCLRINRNFAGNALSTHRQRPRDDCRQRAAERFPVGPTG